MSKLTINHLVAPEGWMDGAIGPLQLISQSVHYGDIPTLEALRNEADDWAEAKHFFDLEENMLEMIIS
jgi:hypothetical protein